MKLSPSRNKALLFGMSAQIFCLLLFGIMMIVPVQLQATPNQTVLVLYDAVDDYGYSGNIYAQLLSNMLSQFPTTVTSSPIENYSNNMLSQYDLSFYIGVRNNNELPAEFLADVLANTKTFCWINGNLWQLAWTWDATGTYHSEAFMQRFGSAYWGIDNSDFMTVLYKGRTLERPIYDTFLHYLYPFDAMTTTVYATATATNGTTGPYITKMDNMWYIADNPFTNLEHKDRYLAFADILFDILDIHRAERHRGLVRIEDVSGVTDPIRLRQVADILWAEKVPFVVSVIPEYQNPFGIWNNGVPQTIYLSDSPAVVSALKYMEQKGGQMLQHGTTHQMDNAKNPYDGQSGVDYEFYKLSIPGTDENIYDDYITYEGPMPGDSAEWARNRIQRGKDEMTAVGLTAMGWNTPHYIASYIDNTVFPTFYRMEFCRGLYYSDFDTPYDTYFLQQIAPYVFQHDTYGAKRMPETLGYVNPGYYPDTALEEMVQRAEANLVVRDGWASFYFHPYLDLNYLKALVRGIKGLGYTFTYVTEDTE